MSAARTAAQITPINGDGTTAMIKAGNAVLGSDLTLSLRTLLMIPGTTMMNGSNNFSMQAARMPA
jgi:hypothetical protein